MSKVAMKDLPYHNGIVMRAFPSDEQLTMIKKNSGCQRLVYHLFSKKTHGFIRGMNCL